GVVCQTAQPSKDGAELVGVHDLVMETNELHDFAGRGHGDLIGILWWYLGQWTAGGGSTLPPTLEGFPPFLHFSAAFGCHRAPSSPRLVLVSACPACPRHRLGRVCQGLQGRPKTRQRPSSCLEETLGRAAKAKPPLLADRRRRIVYGRGIP